MPEKIHYCACISEHNSKREKQLILLVILNGEGWHYIAVKKLSALLRKIASKNNFDFYCLYLFRTKNKLNLIKRYMEMKIFAVI